MASSKVNVKVKVITKMEERQVDANGRKTGSCDAIDSITKSVKTLFVTERHIGRFQVGKFFMIRGVVLGDSLRVTDQTVVLSCGAFDFDKDTGQLFLNPPTVNVEEALSSPKKRRISVCGTLNDVSDVLTTERSRRKILKISDGHNNFVVKLWGDKANESTPPVGSEVTVKGVIVAEFRGEKEGNSSTATSIVECADEVPFEGVVDAAAFDGDESWIILVDEDKIMSLPSTMLQAVFGDLEFVPNVAVVGRRKGTRVLEVKAARPEQD